MSQRGLRGRTGLGLLVSFLVAGVLSGQVRPPELEAVVPFDVLPDEPTLVYVYGRNFQWETRITIEGVGELLDTTFYGPTLITGYTPPLDPSNPNQPPGLKSIVARHGTPFSFLQNGILYVPYGEPYLKHCWPSEVGPEGGTLIHFYGRNFRKGLVPRFEGVPCTDPVLVSENEMTAVSPALEPRPQLQYYKGELADGPGGPIVSQQRESMLAVYEGSRPPVLIAVEPMEVDARGGTPISIHGENLRLDDSTTLEVVGAFGGHSLFVPESELVSPELITGYAPAVIRGAKLFPEAPPGPRDLRIHDPRGESLLVGALHYVDQIRAVTPRLLSAAGGEAVAFEGFGFHASFQPRLGGLPLVDDERIDDTLWIGKAPPLPPGLHEATLLNFSGVVVMGHLPDAVEVVAFLDPAITSVTPPEVPASGGVEVTFGGAGFQPDLTPRLGGAPLLGGAFVDSSTFRGFSPELEPGFHAADLLDPSGKVVASLPEAVLAVATEPDETLAVPTQFETSLAQGTARFTWHNPIGYDQIIVRDLGAFAFPSACGSPIARLEGIEIARLPGNTREFQLAALGNDVRLSFQGLSFQGASDPALARARINPCEVPRPLNGRDFGTGKLQLTLYGGSDPAEVTRCAGGGGGGGGGAAAGEAVRGHAGGGGAVQPLDSKGYVQSSAHRYFSGDRVGEPRGRSNTNKLVTGFTLGRDAERLEIAAFYNQIAVAHELSLRGRLIQVYPDDGFTDEFTFPETVIDRDPEDWKATPNCVVYYRADKDVGIFPPEGEPPPRPCSGSPRIPRGDYLLEIYAVGGDPQLPYYMFQDDGKGEEILIKDVPCPPYPRVRVTDLTGLRTIQLAGFVLDSRPIGLLGTTVEVKFYAVGQVFEGGETYCFGRDRDASDLGLEFSWKLHHRVPAVTHLSGASNVLRVALTEPGCFEVEVRVLDKVCGLAKERRGEARILPAELPCGSEPNSFICPKPSPETVVATVALRPGPAGGAFSGRRPFESRVLVVPCCGQPDPRRCPAPDVLNLEFRLATPLAPGTREHDYRPIASSRDAAGSPTHISIQNLCQNQGSGPIFVHLAIDDLGALPRVPHAGPPDDPIASGLCPKAVYLQGRTKVAGSEFRNIGKAMRLFNPPASLARSYWSGYYVPETQSYHYTTKSSPESAQHIPMRPSAAIPLPLAGLDIKIPSFRNDMNAGLVSAFVNSSGIWRPEQAVGTMTGELLGNALDGAPLEAAASTVTDFAGQLQGYDWCQRLQVLNNHFSQTLFESILFTGSIGPIPVTVWASIKFALGVQVTAQTNIKIRPFAVLEGEPQVSSDFYLDSKVDVQVPCQIRADVLFGIASIAARLIPRADALFRAHVGVRDLAAAADHYFRASLSLFFEVEACLLFICFTPARVTIFNNKTLIEDGAQFAGAEFCNETGGGGGGAAAAAEPLAAFEGQGGGTPSHFRVFQSTSSPATDVAGDETTLDAWIDERGNPLVFINGVPLRIPEVDARTGSFLDPAVAFVSNTRVLISWTKPFAAETGLDPLAPNPSLEEENHLHRQNEIVISPVRLEGGFWEILPSIRIADVPAEVPDLNDRRADGRSSLAWDNSPRQEALVAWVRFDTPDMFIAAEEPTRVWHEAMNNGELPFSDEPTVRAQLEKTAIYARRVGLSGPIGPAVRLSPPGINIEPVVAFSPSGNRAYCVWVHDPTHTDLIRSNLGRSLLYAVYSSATDSWSAPAAVIASPDDYPGLLEPNIALRGDSRGLLVFTAMESTSSELDTGLAGGNRYVYTCRLENGVFGAPVRIHGKCDQRVYGHWVKIPLPRKELYRVPGFGETVIRMPDYPLVFQASDPLGLPESRGVVKVAAIGAGEAAFAPAVTVNQDLNVRSNVTASISSGVLRAISLNGGPSLLGLGGGAGAGGSRAYDVQEVRLEPDLAITRCTLSEQFPAPGTVVTAAVDIENIGFAGAAETMDGVCLAGLRALFIAPGGSVRVAAEAKLPLLLPGGKTTVELSLEQPHDPVTLRVEIFPNPVDRDRSNDVRQCFFGAPEPRDFACQRVTLPAELDGEEVEIEAVSLSWTNAAEYDEITLYRDGEVFAALPGASRSFIDTAAPPGPHLYEIRSRVGVSKSCRVALECGAEPPPPSRQFRRGDVNASGRVDISDAISLLGFLFLGGSVIPCKGAADADDSGRLDITDAIRILNYLFLGAAAPPAPGPDHCGVDPTKDDLECEAVCR